jgi:hypothetical protein
MVEQREWGGTQLAQSRIFFGIASLGGLDDIVVGPCFWVLGSFLLFSSAWRRLCIIRDLVN